ncbi:NAD-binding protein [Antribacter sp. KLBMP9083]|uniref:NAD-binding protein n=1 Tax=Antribacter soli TaxID=2910976 RepID=A0AA41QGZ7_9MICO|nr:NAD-binding protein [Antribacter soli]MCF4121914.1 NAD-binding protein [Antribacter soli]
MVGDSSDAPRRHFVVCGDNPLAYRVTLALCTRYEGTVRVVLADPASTYAVLMAGLPHVEVVAAERADAAALERAGAAHADAVALLQQDDGGNVDTALLVDERWPGTRLVVRIFDDDLGASLEKHIPGCQAMSSSGFAAPEIVALALREPTRLHVPDRNLVITHPHTPLPVIAPLFAGSGHRSDPVRPLPAGDDLPVRVLAAAPPEDTAPPAPRRPRRTTLRTIGMVAGRNLRIALAVVVVLVVLGTAAIAQSTGGDWPWAMYVSILTALGGTDPDGTLGLLGRTTHVLLTVVGVAVVPLVTAALVDGVVRARLLLDRGELTEPMSGHVVVVGLGDLGARVVSALAARGVDVVAVDRDEQARGVAVARELQVPVVIGDARVSATLRAAYTGDARAVVVVTGGTATTIGIGFAADAVDRTDGAGELRVVLRVFDEGLRTRLQRKAPHFRCVSASHLAAPRFAAATLGQDVIDTIPYLDRVLLVAGIEVTDDGLARRFARDLEEPGAVKVLALHTAQLDGGGGGRTIDPGLTARPLRPRDTLYVIATTDGLRRLRQQTR